MTEMTTTNILFEVRGCTTTIKFFGSGNSLFVLCLQSAEHHWLQNPWLWSLRTTIIQVVNNNNGLLKAGTGPILLQREVHLLTWVEEDLQFWDLSDY